MMSCWDPCRVLIFWTFWVHHERRYLTISYAIYLPRSILYTLAQSAELFTGVLVPGVCICDFWIFFVDDPVLDNDPVLEDKPNHITWKWNRNERAFLSQVNPGQFIVVQMPRADVRIVVAWDFLFEPRQTKTKPPDKARYLRVCVEIAKGFATTYRFGYYMRVPCHQNLGSVGCQFWTGHIGVPKAGWMI